MPSFPRSNVTVGAQGLTKSLGRVSSSDITSAVSGEALQGFGKELHDKGQRILQREGETLAIEQFSDFQRSELLRFNEEKAEAINNPEGFTERFLEQSQQNFNDLTKDTANKFYSDVMTSRFSGLTNSLTFSSTSFEAKQKTTNRKKRYAAAVGSYASTVYDDPTQLGNIINLAKGDAAAAVGSGIFGAEGVDLVGGAAKTIATSAVMGVVEKSPQDLETFLDASGVKNIFNDKELKNFRKHAMTNFKNIPKVELIEKQMKLVAEKEGVMQSYIDGNLSLGAIDNMTELTEEERDTARTLAVGGKKENKNPEKLADLIDKRKELLSRDDLTVGDNLADLVAFQNEVYNALGTDINNTEAKTLLKGTTSGINEALEQEPKTIGAKYTTVFGMPLFGHRELSPEEKTIIAIDQFAGEKDASIKRSILRNVSNKIDSIDLDGFDNTERDENGLTMQDRQVNAVIQSEIKNKVKGLSTRKGTPNRVVGKDGVTSTVTENAPTTKPDQKVKIPPEKIFATVKEAEASGAKGLVLIGGRRARID